jgi:leader peptidase (prepilin peptidase)/N-methyltransferase
MCPPSPRVRDGTPAEDSAPVAAALRRAAGVAGLTAAALGIAALSWRAFDPRTAAISCLLGWTMLAIAAIDARSFTIPDALSLPAIPAGLLLSGYLADPAAEQLVSLDQVLGAGLGGCGFWLVREGYFRVRGREGLGLGDVKLAAAAGAWTGWQHLSDAVLLAAAAALSLTIAVALVRGRSLAIGHKIAFGVYLAPAIWIVWALRALTQGL